MNKDAGFNSVEIMVVLAIIGILSTIAIPALSNFLPTYRLKSSVREVTSALYTARFNAVSKKGKYGVFFNDKLTPNKFIIFKDLNYNNKLDSNDIIQRGGGLLASGIISNNNFRDKTVIFKSNGSVTRGGSINIKGYEQKGFKVSVAPVTGKISLKRQKVKS